MIDVKVDVGEITIRTVEGNGLTIMSELCVIVDSVCSAWAADEEEDAKVFRRVMMENIADAIKRGAKKRCGLKM